MEIYNTLTKRKEKFIPRDDGQVCIYVCGPTTYNYIHLGNARPLVFFDTVRRYFTQQGFQVNYVQNFTDIDDKIIKKSIKEGLDAAVLSQRYIEEYYRDADALNVTRANRHPRVSEHMKEIIEMVSVLIEKGFAYEVEGDVYFDVPSFREYGKLSHRSSDEILAGARVEVDPRKKTPADFALWKAAKEGEPFWESPWGAGRPGWHIECSVMSLKYLGSGFDIHGGGMDLIFPHHENEIAQSEAATGKPFAKYWIHNGFITINQDKMSKSLGNFFLVREIFEKFNPLSVRFFLLSTHYRSPLDFDFEKLEASGQGLERLKNSIELLEEAIKKRSSAGLKEKDSDFQTRLIDLKKRFNQAMDDDFNTALAIGVFFEAAKEVNTFLNQNTIFDKADLVRAIELYAYFNNVLGLFKTDPDGKFILDEKSHTDDSLIQSLIELLLKIRQEARTKKDWATADRIRNGLNEMGIIIEDTPDGARWKISTQ
ncbi:MAG TPA: cysteine--tRNA ligase [Desulfotomaculum sp.]|nr:MAG: Cysteine--tRNA ligase [Desulfotomaculum sp. 46_80]KUK85261.1 MAG: Cysteine--tRNA ligase [Desulfofundulus kuznetsovii]HAG11444.1 cysteine--tRNA ligase [Desulfotomaculum sp.]HBY03236.1 cysteine--tRNA ligase [Desulfotomaculum sp.]